MRTRRRLLSPSVAKHSSEVIAITDDDKEAARARGGLKRMPHVLVESAPMNAKGIEQIVGSRSSFFLTVCNGIIGGEGMQARDAGIIECMQNQTRKYGHNIIRATLADPYATSRMTVDAGKLDDMYEPDWLNLTDGDENQQAVGYDLAQRQFLTSYLKHYAYM